MLRRDQAGWSNPKVLAVLAVIFLCGAAFGSAITRSYLHARMFHPRSDRAIEMARQVGLERLKTVLNLSPAQEHTVTAVLDDYGKYYQNIEDEREDVAELGKQRILAVLTPDQKKQFKQIFENVSR
jgi:hypothetical protein